MSNRRVFVIERKSFVVAFSKDVVESCEKGRSFQVSVRLEVKLVEWFLRKLQGLVEDQQGEPRQGLLGSRKGNSMDLMLNIKKNKRGFYLSLLCFSSSFSKGFKCLCFPIGFYYKGWKALLHMLYHGCLTLIWG